MVTSKFALRHNGVHFFHISTSKSAPGISQNVLRVTTACNFSSLIPPHVSAPTALASLLCEPPQWKKHVFYLFAHLDLDLLSSGFLFSDLLSSCFLFSDSSHLCFSICPYCGSLTSKLHSVISTSGSSRSHFSSTALELP